MFNKSKSIKDFKRHLPAVGILMLLAFSITFWAGCTDKSKDKTQDKKENVSAQKKVYYTCTMHPQVISDKPGACPICGMELVKKTVDEEPAEDIKDMNGMVTLNGQKLVLANVSTVKAERKNLYKEVIAFSYLDFAEQNRKLISAKFNGRIEKLFVNQTGNYIRKGEPLFEIYSPDLVQAQNEYVIASKGNETASLIPAGNSGNTSLLNSARKKLELLGLTADQIKKLDESGDVQLTVTYYSPYSGTVIDKKVQEGIYVNEGSVIYDIADMSLLWDISEVNENDLNVIKTGNTAELNLQSFPGEKFNGRVTFIYPVVNQQSRTIKIRSEFNNPGGKLKPQMYGQTVFHNSFGTGILIPSQAILFTGKRNVVWVKTSAGMFESREIQVGNKFEDNYQVLSGLEEGDEVAATGGFLIDSESQLKTGAASSGHQHGDAGNLPKKNSQPGKQNDKMDNM